MFIIIYTHTKSKWKPREIDKFDNFPMGRLYSNRFEYMKSSFQVKKADGNVNEFLTLMDQNVNQIVVHDKISERVANAAEIVDVCGYNYMIARYEKDVMEYPDRMIVGSETYPPEIGRIWGVIQEYPQIIGDFTWTGWEYIGEAGLGIPAFAPGEGGFGARFPSQLAYSGSLFTWR